MGSRLSQSIIKLLSSKPAHLYSKIPTFDLFALEKHYATLLRDFAESQNISNGRALHSHMLKTLQEPHLFLSNSLVNMYCKCRSIGDAHKVFDEMPQRDVISWNTMVDGCFLSGLFADTFGFFMGMLRSGVAPDEFSFTSVFKSCFLSRDFGNGLGVHGVVIKYGFGGSAFVGNELVEFYAKFGFLDECMKVSDSLEFKDVVFISTVIALLAKAGIFEEAFVMFRDDVLAASLVPTRATFVYLLGGIDGYEPSREGMQVHGLVVKLGFEADGAVQNSLVAMYCSCGLVDDASDLLIQLGSKNVMHWTTLIKGYANLGCFQDAIKAFFWIYSESKIIDSVALTCVVSIAADSNWFQSSSQFHSTICKCGFDSDPCVVYALMDLYAKCGCMGDAIKLFQQIDHNHNEVPWTIMVAGHAYNGLFQEALRFFYLMHREGISPDSIACIGVLMGCIDLQAIHQGEQVHAFVIKTGYETDISVQTTLLSLYSKCGRLGEVNTLFNTMMRHDVVSWTALLSAYSKLEYNEETVIGLDRMLHDGIKPNNFTLASVLTAAARRTSIQTGKSLHALATKVGLEQDKVVGSALIDMYSKCGNIESAVLCFRKASTRDRFVWNALLTGHAQHGNVLELLTFFEEMLGNEVRPDRITFLALLTGCSRGGCVDKVIHFYNVMQSEYEIKPEVEHCTCVVDALGRAGMFKEAVDFIQGSWFIVGPEVLRTLISSCATFGHVQLGLAAAAKMVILGQTSSSTHVLLSNLYACDGRWIDARRARDAAETNYTNIKEVGKSWISC